MTLSEGSSIILPELSGKEFNFRTKNWKVNFFTSGYLAKRKRRLRKL